MGLNAESIAKDYGLKPLKKQTRKFVGEVATLYESGHKAVAVLTQHPGRAGRWSWEWTIQGHTMRGSGYLHEMQRDYVTLLVQVERDLLNKEEG